MTTDITQTLQERGNRYGKFGDQARITQNIKRAMADSRNWRNLTDSQRESLGASGWKDRTDSQRRPELPRLMA